MVFMHSYKYLILLALLLSSCSGSLCVRTNNTNVPGDLFGDDSVDKIEVVATIKF